MHCYFHQRWQRRYGNKNSRARWIRRCPGACRIRHALVVREANFRAFQTPARSLDLLLPPSIAQVGYEIAKEKHLTKPQLGHLRKSNLPNLRRLGEFRVKSTDGYEIGQKLEVSPCAAHPFCVCVCVCARARLLRPACPPQHLSQTH